MAFAGDHESRLLAEVVGSSGDRIVRGITDDQEFVVGSELCRDLLARIVPGVRREDDGRRGIQDHDVVFTECDGKRPAHPRA